MAVAVFISLMVARLITPVLAAYALSGDAMSHQEGDGPIMTAYLWALRWCAVNRWKTMGLAFFVDAHLIGVAFLVPSTFMPPEDFANAQLSIELPPGGTLEDTARVSAAASAILRQSPEVTNIIEFVGSSDGLIQNANIYVSHGNA